MFIAALLMPYKHPDFIAVGPPATLELKRTTPFLEALSRGWRPVLNIRQLLRFVSNR